MKTSYFSIDGKYKYLQDNGISIAGKSPNGFPKEREYKKLAPKYWFWKKWHDGEFTNDDYIYYYEEILNKLDPVYVYNELIEINNGRKNDIVLLCYEKVGDFCHRHLVSKWFNDTLNLNVVEFDYSALKGLDIKIGT